MRPWGSIIARSLSLALAACATQPPPEPEAPSPPPPMPEVAPTPPPVAPAAIAPRISDFVSLLPGTEGARELPAKRLSARSAAFAVEVADLHREWGTPSCVVANAGCNLVAVAKWSAPLAPKDWLAADEPPGLSAFSPPEPGAAPWVDLSGGRELVYGARRGVGLVVDRIDASGKATPWLEDAHELSWTSARVVETAAGQVVVGTVEVDDISKFRVARVEEKGGKRRLGEVITLPYSRVPEFRPSAQGARQAEADHDGAVWGPWVALPLLDASGGIDRSWALVLVQVTAPPFNAKRGVTHQKKGGKAGAKHGCGGPGSRPLTDASVEKKLRVLRFEGAKLVSDTAVDRLPRYDAHVDPFEVGALPEGAVEVNHVTWSADGKKQTTRPGKPARHTREVAGLSGFTYVEPRTVTAGVDPASGEGQITDNTSSGKRARRFDRDGKPKEEPFVSDGRVGGEGSTRVGTEWLTWGALDLAWLTGPAMSKAATWDYQAGSALDVLVRDDGRADLLLTRYDGCALLTIDLKTMKKGDAKNLPFCDGDHQLRSGRVIDSRGKEVAIRVADNGNEVALVSMDGEVRMLPEESKPTHVDKADARAEVTVHPVFGDTVVVRRGAEDATATWLRAGKTIHFDAGKEQGGTRSGGRRQGRRWVPPPEQVEGGAVLQRLSMLLPDQPGPPIEIPALSDAANGGCSRYFVAGARRGILLCNEPTDPKKPGIVAGVRVLTY